MGKLLLREDKSLDLDSVGTLSRDEMAQWIRLRLHGNDRLVPTDVRQGEPSFHLLASIYAKLDRDSRSFIRTAVADFLSEMMGGDQNWQGSAGHSLLLLAQELRERDFLGPILGMAERSLFLTCDNTDTNQIHRRLLQSLVALEWRGQVDFWHSAFARSPAIYAAVAFAGLSLISVRHAMELLPKVPFGNGSTRHAMRIALRGLLPVHDRDLIRRELTRVTPLIDKQYRGVVEEILPEVIRLGRKAPVLVISEDENISSALTEFKIRTESDASSALADADIHVLELVVLDLDTEGDATDQRFVLGLLPTLLERVPVPAILMSTALLRARDRDTAILNGANRFMTKPFDSDELSRNASALIGEYKQNPLSFRRMRSRDSPSAQVPGKKIVDYDEFRRRVSEAAKGEAPFAILTCRFEPPGPGGSRRSVLTARRWPYVPLPELREGDLLAFSSESETVFLLSDSDANKFITRLANEATTKMRQQVQVAEHYAKDGRNHYVTLRVAA
jgi:DNA-binding response OmpR family regulator